MRTFENNEYGCIARTRALYFPIENKIHDVMLQMEHMGDDAHLLNALHNLRDALAEIGIYYDNKIKTLYNAGNE